MDNHLNNFLRVEEHDGDQQYGNMEGKCIMNFTLNNLMVAKSDLTNQTTNTETESAKDLFSFHVKPCTVSAQREILAYRM